MKAVVFSMNSSINGKLPEPLRLAHLVAGAIDGAASRRRP